MIQRVQSIFLFIAAVAAFAILFLPIWGKIDPSTGQKTLITAMKMVHVDSPEATAETTNTIVISILAVLSSVVALGSLFSFKDRLKQMKLNLLNALILASTVAVIIYYYYNAQESFAPEMRGEFGYGFFMPLIALFCNSLANRFIRKDERLVKSVDRLR